LFKKHLSINHISVYRYFQKSFGAVFDILVNKQVSFTWIVSSSMSTH